MRFVYSVQQKYETDMNDPKRVLIMAGGTGGHVIPALSVAKTLQDQFGCQVEWIGTAKGLETALVPQANITLHLLPISGVRRSGLWRKFMFPWQLLQAVVQSLLIMRRFKPHVVLGMGGYASGPGGIAAWLLRVPLVIHEQNSIAGMTNAYLAKLADCVLAAFPNTFAERLQPIVTGNPVRSDIAQLPEPRARFRTHAPPLKLLILGGSLGALKLNQQIPRCIQKIALDSRPEIWHQCGRAHLEKTQEEYATAGVGARIESFIDDMASAYQWADLVICRAGALTIAELAAAGLGSILVPYPFAVDDHQTTNAQYLVAQEAAILIPESALTPENLFNYLEPYLRSPEKCLALALAARRCHHGDPTVRVAEKCLQVSQQT